MNIQQSHEPANLYSGIGIQLDKPVSADLPSEQFYPGNLGWVLGKPGMEQFVSSLSEAQRNRVSEILYLMDKKPLRWASENLTAKGMRKLVERFSRSMPAEDTDVNEYWTHRKPYFDFRRIGGREVATQIAIVKGLAQLSEKALMDVVTHAEANLWPLACFGWSSAHVFEWADKLSDEMAGDLYSRMSKEHVWVSRTLLDVIVVLTGWDEKLKNRSHLWASWQILYTCVNSGLAFRLAVRDYSEEQKFFDYRVLALAALKDSEAVTAFEAAHDMNSTADEALAWFADWLKTNPVNREVTEPRWYWELAQEIALKNGVELIWWSK